MDEKDFLNTLYAVIQRLFEQPRPLNLEAKDFGAFLKCMDIVFCKRRQISIETTNAFVKRLALLQVHLEPAQQAGVLLLIKQILNKYATARSAMLDFEDDSVGGGFQMTPDSCLYRADINDPQLANASQSPAVFELVQTF
jgi:nucleolar complex protein 3